MKTIKKYLLPLLIMCIVSILMLLGVSVLAYIYKWKAEKALMGITVTYIFAGFAGGFGLRCVSQTRDIGKKMIESIVLGMVFMMVLVLFSVLLTDNTVEVSSRFFLIWMLITGSASLSRIL